MIARQVSLRPPCEADPDAWLQPGEDRGWHLTARAQWAAAQCVPCRLRLDCARAALTDGALEDGRPRTANGVVMAGVICDGTGLTIKRLLAVLGEHSGPRPRCCRGCGQPMNTRGKCTPGEVRHEAGGRCTACVRIRKRAAS